MSGSLEITAVNRGSVGSGRTEKIVQLPVFGASQAVISNKSPLGDQVTSGVTNEPGTPVSRMSIPVVRSTMRTRGRGLRSSDPVAEPGRIGDAGPIGDQVGNRRPPRWAS